MTNAELAEASLPDRVDHRSYAARGIDLVPGEHLGPAAAALERQQFATEAGERNRKRRRRKSKNKGKSDTALDGVENTPNSKKVIGTHGQSVELISDLEFRARLRLLASARTGSVAPALVRAVRHGTRLAEKTAQTFLEE